MSLIHTANILMDINVTKRLEEQISNKSRLLLRICNKNGRRRREFTQFSMPATLHVPAVTNPPWRGSESVLRKTRLLAHAERGPGHAAVCAASDA
jgi:hypothetical protein